MAQKIFTSTDWEKSAGRYWTTFFNTVSGPRSAVVIGTEDERKTGNLGLFNSLVHIGANPPLLGFILRPTTVARHTYDNITSNGSYSINQLHPTIIDQAHQTSAKYDASSDEFTEVGLTKEYLNDFRAPFVQESELKLGLKFKEEHFIETNGTRLIIGEVVIVSVPEQILESDGFINTAKIQTVLASGLDAYHNHELIGRKAYAKP